MDTYTAEHFSITYFMVALSFQEYYYRLINQLINLLKIIVIEVFYNWCVKSSVLQE